MMPPETDFQFCGGEYQLMLETTSKIMFLSKDYIRILTNDFIDLRLI